MSSMARHTNFARAVDDAAGATNRAAAKRTTLLRRIFDAAMAARQRQADRHMVPIVDRAGGLLTDDVEREMARRRATGFGNLAD